MDAVKKNEGDENQHPQGEQPEEGEEIPLLIKKDDRPQEVEKQLHPIHEQRILHLSAVASVHKHEVGGKSHKEIQNGPHHREKPAGRGEGRLVERPERLHTVPGEQGRQPAHRKRD